MTHKITLLERVPLTPDTHHYVFSKPDGYKFKPGQATDLAIDADGWRDAERPFTFTSAPDADVLSFVIKSYPERDSVTAELPDLAPGATAKIGDPWGAIEDHGPGTFIAGGAGITPFLGILRDRARNNGLEGCHLIFANQTPDDIILNELWDGLDDLKATYVVEKNAGDAYREGQIDGTLLDDVVTDWDGRFYVCGPPPLEESVINVLKERGVTDDRIIRES